MHIRSILTFYILRLFIKMFIFTSLGVFLIIVISNVFDILQSFKNHNLAMKEFWLLVLFKAPDIFNEVIIIISLVATIAFIQSIRQNNELLVMISSGIPISQIFIVPVLMSLIFGVLLISINGLFSPYLLIKYKNLESRITGKNDLNVMVSQAGIFFSEKFEQENRIAQVKYINVEQHKLGGLTIIQTDMDNNFIARIDADEAILANGFYAIETAKIDYNIRADKAKSHQIVDNLLLPTTLKIDSLKNRFNPPKMIGIWNLKNAIKKFKKSGLAVHQYQLYYYKQLLKPFGLMVMSLVACCFVTLNLRNNSNSYVVASSILIGLLTYFLQEIFVKILVYNGFSAIIAILIPIIVISSISIFVILHFQEA